jgi:cell division protein FtsL
MINFRLETSWEKRILLLVILISVIIISYTVCVKVISTFLEISSAIENLNTSVKEISIEVECLKTSVKDISHNINILNKSLLASVKLSIKS